MQLSAIALLLSTLVVSAAQASEGEPLPPPHHADAPEASAPMPLPPALPEEAEPVQIQGDGHSVEQVKGAKVERFMRNGMVYMLRITPDKGPPYYLIDQDGDGSFESRRNDLDNPPLNQWRIFSW